MSDVKRGANLAPDTVETARDAIAAYCEKTAALISNEFPVGAAEMRAIAARTRESLPRSETPTQPSKWREKQCAKSEPGGQSHNTGGTFNGPHLSVRVCTFAPKHEGVCSWVVAPVSADEPPQAEYYCPQCTLWQNPPPPLHEGAYACPNCGHRTKVRDVAGPSAAESEQPPILHVDKDASPELVGALLTMADKATIQALHSSLGVARTDNARLRLIITSDGLDPDMPIPPGLNTQLQRAYADLEAARKALEEAEKKACAISDRVLRREGVGMMSDLACELVEVVRAAARALGDKQTPAPQEPA